MTLPLYQVIRDDIDRRIRSGELRPGDRIPFEHDLMRQYGCARMTVNKAIGALVADGLIERRKKVGSFVRMPQLVTPIVDIPDIEVEVTARGEAYLFKLLSRTVEEGGSVLALTGIHYAADRPLAYEERRINLMAIPEAESADFETRSPGHWLLVTVPWTHVETQIGAEPAPASLSRRVGWDKDTACLVVTRQTWRGEAWVTRVRQAFDGKIYRVTASLDEAR